MNIGIDIRVKSVQNRNIKLEDNFGLDWRGKDIRSQAQIISFVSIQFCLDSDNT